MMFDLQLEAEAMGCELAWASETPPAVTTHPLERTRSLAELPPFDLDAARLPLAFEVTRRMKAQVGDRVGIYGLICGPFTLAMHLMGNDLFMQMYDHSDYVKAVVGYCASIGRKMAHAYIDAGGGRGGGGRSHDEPDIARAFTEFVTPYVNQVFDAVRARERFSSLFVCGDASRNLDEMSKTACDNLSIDENIPLALLRDTSRTTGKSFGGNLKLASVLLFGDADDCRLDAIRCIDVAGGAGFILAPGCDLPYATPPENLEAVAEMVHDAYGREVCKRTIIAKELSAATCDLPADYTVLPHVVIDVVTLDSASCAPCQYMMDAVHRAVAALALPVEVKGASHLRARSLAAMQKLGVRNIPTICIDGQIAFVSLIPDLRRSSRVSRRHSSRSTLAVEHLPHRDKLAMLVACQSTLSRFFCRQQFLFGWWLVFWGLARRPCCAGSSRPRARSGWCMWLTSFPRWTSMRR
jgi:uroporphyrinogen decarboxylase